MNWDEWSPKPKPKTETVKVTEVLVDLGNGFLTTPKHPYETKPDQPAKEPIIIRRIPDPHPAPGPHLVRIEEITREEAKQRWPDRAKEIDAVPTLSLQCQRCYHKWLRRNLTTLPKTCPKCCSPYWNRPRRVLP